MECFSFYFITDNWNKRIRAGLGANCYNYDGTTRVIRFIGQLHLRWLRTRQGTKWEGALPLQGLFTQDGRADPRDQSTGTSPSRSLLIPLWNRNNNKKMAHAGASINAAPLLRRTFFLMPKLSILFLWWPFPVPQWASLNRDSLATFCSEKSAFRDESCKLGFWIEKEIWKAQLYFSWIYYRRRRVGSLDRKEFVLCLVHSGSSWPTISQAKEAA